MTNDTLRVGDRDVPLASLALGGRSLPDALDAAEQLFLRAHADSDHAIARQTKRSDGTPRPPLMLWCCAGIVACAELRRLRAVERAARELRATDGSQGLFHSARLLAAQDALDAALAAAPPETEDKDDA